MKALILVSALCFAFAAAKQDYKGFKVYRLHAKNAEQSDFLHSLEDDDKLDFWTDPNKVFLPVDVMVRPSDQSSFLEKLNEAGIESEIYIEDVQSLVQEEEKQMKATHTLRDSMDWTSYHDLENIYSWLRSLQAAHPGVVTTEVGGRTFEGREILGVKVSFGPGRRAVFLEGGIHAREWISPATITYLVDQILTNQDPVFRKIANSFDWYAFPVINPDGYAFTHTASRMWRKTRSPGNVFCRGVDPNRNWDINWRVAGTSSNPCSESYGGSRPFSEVETRTLAKYLDTIGKNLVAYLSFHSYSQLVLLPYGHTTAHLDNYDQAMRVGTKAVKALAVRYGTKYQIGNIAETIYPASGGSGDWVKDRFKVPLVYTYELRDRGNHGFLLPPEQILPNSLEVFDSVQTIFEEGAKEGIFTFA